MANESCLEWWQHLKDFGLMVRSSQATASNYADFVKIQKTRKARESALKVVGYVKIQDGKLTLNRTYGANRFELLW